MVADGGAGGVAFGGLDALAQRDAEGWAALRRGA
jgi:hypothetical protein